MLCSRAAPLAQRRLAPLAEGGKGFGARSAAPKAAPKRKAQNAPRLTKASPVPEGFGIACRLEQAPAENAKVRAGGELASGAGAWRQRRTRARLTRGKESSREARSSPPRRVRLRLALRPRGNA